MRWLPGTSIFTSVAAMSAGERTVSGVVPRPGLLGSGPRPSADRLARVGGRRPGRRGPPPAAAGRATGGPPTPSRPRWRACCSTWPSGARRCWSVATTTPAARHRADRRRGGHRLRGPLRTDAAPVLLPLTPLAAVHMRWPRAPAGRRPGRRRPSASTSTSPPRWPCWPRTARRSWSSPPPRASPATSAGSAPTSLAVGRRLRADRRHHRGDDAVITSSVWPTGSG